MDAVVYNIAIMSQRHSEQNREAMVAMLAALNRLTAAMDLLLKDDRAGAASEIGIVRHDILQAVNILSDGPHD